jgi:hypothetical protein
MNNQLILSVLVIDQFLQEWKEKAFQYYKDLQKRYLIERKKEYEINFENLKIIRRSCWDDYTFGQSKYNDEQINQLLEKINSNNMIQREIDNLKCDIHYHMIKKWEQMIGKTNISIIQHDDQWIEKFLDREVEAKKQNLITRITKKAGNILDASGLYIANNGEINGLIKGDIKTVKVETITAGGYNIQCYHFRVLVK